MKMEMNSSLFEYWMDDYRICGKFEKVSLEQFEKDLDKCYQKNKFCFKHITYELKIEGEIQSSLIAENIYKDIILPTRATKGSAGYDIHLPMDITLFPNETKLIPIGIKCKIKNGWFLGAFPKSGLGFKYGLRLDNTIGVIDSDYYNNSNNEGHIMVQVTNPSTETILLEKGKSICQGIFIPFGITEDDETEGIRNGGFGSTNS